MTHPYEEHVFRRFVDGIVALEPNIRPKVYVLSLGIETFWGPSPEGEMTCEGWLRLGYLASENAGDEDGENQETDSERWPISWLVTEPAAVVPAMPTHEGPIDEAELSLRADWCAANGFIPTGKDDSGRPEYGNDYYRGVEDLAVRIARRLHAEGVIGAHFGRELPVIIAPGEDAIADKAATIAANPEEALSECLPWL